ncbi:zinc finger C2HC domain-containing protein 1C isoform X2 [Pyxicephalus adspersus]|uniref:C2HC/C3H-type domain-containing protein n=1 Tax=Pyxicephalus adspersus TaxID=30357 RepID=A0AAV2ZX25_PYXAD|nr:TPA: hypothetical protein GDO54_005533 [Pyxicephalus adspersus]
MSCDLHIKRVSMAKLRMAPYTYPEGLSDSRLPTLQAPKMLSRLEMLKNDYQERSLRAKEEKMMTLLTQQQDRISQRVNGSSLHSGHPSSPHKPFQELQQHPYSGLWAPEERAWASNWTVTKRTAGIDRAHPLKPVYHHKSTTHGTDSHHPPSANITRYKTSGPVQEQVRSKSGPARTDSWQQLEKKQFSLEAEIRRKEALLREKLRKTEEELRRIQKEKEEAEIEDRQAPAIQDNRRVRAITTQRRTTKTYQYSKYNEEGESPDYPIGDRLYQDLEDKCQIQEPTSDTKTKQLSRQTPDNILINGSSHSSPHGDHTIKSFRSAHVEEDNGEDLAPCQLCGRNFMVQRLEKHMQVCQKMLNYKRKVFDSSKARAKGTDLEQYLHTKGRTKDPTTQIKGSSWRQKHESFIRTIRQARLVQNVVSKGGNPSDLPAPPPEENPDYVTCPHCTRRFAPRAAERHIPKCETIKSKPRPPPARRR